MDLVPSGLPPMQSNHIMSVCSECQSELESAVVDAVHAEGIAPVCGIAVIQGELKSEIGPVERMPSESHLRRCIKAPVLVIDSILAEI